MICSECHTENPANARFCAQCGTALAAGSPHYASFWLRMVAFWIDMFILSIVYMALSVARIATQLAQLEGGGTQSVFVVSALILTLALALLSVAHLAERADPGQDGRG